VIDLHCHLLPGVDDGAKSVDQAVAVLQRMADQGIREIALTPHLDASRISEGPPPEHDEAFAILSRQAPTEIRLVRGAEVMLDRPMTPRALATRRVTLGGTRFILVEFTRMVAVPAATAALGQLLKAGLVPVVAHPERYPACTPTVIERWRGQGVRTQVDANTLFVPTGRGARARSLLAAGLADILAADNHGDDRSLAEPYQRLADSGGAAQAALLMVDNPAAILADEEPIDVAPFDVKISLLTRFKGWMGQVGE